MFTNLPPADINLNDPEIIPTLKSLNAPILTKKVQSSTLIVIPIGKVAPNRIPSTKGPYQHVKKDKFLKEASCRKISRLPCSCGQHCALKFQDWRAIAKEREAFWAKGAKEQNTFIYDSLNRNGIVKDPPESNFSFRYVIDGKHVCSFYYEKFFPICHQRFISIRKKVTNARRPREDPTSHFKKSPKMQFLKTWMEKFFQEVGQAMPDKEEVHLPACFTRQCIFEAYQYSVLANLTLEFLVSRSYFYETWTKEFPRVKIYRWTRFSQCDICNALTHREDRAENAAERRKYTKKKICTQAHLSDEIFSFFARKLICQMSFFYFLLESSSVR